MLRQLFDELVFDFIVIVHHNISIKDKVITCYPLGIAKK